MLKINNNFKRYRIPLIAGGVAVGGVFLFQNLTFIPEYSSAEEISTTDPVILPDITGEITTKFGTESAGYRTYMQEINLNYCQKLPSETTGQLVDGRDGKIYWATVLGTGDTKTCWMTQDLDFDLGPNGPSLVTTNDGDNLYKGSATTWTGGKTVTSSKTNWPTTNGNPTKSVNWWERDNGTHEAQHTFLGNIYSFEAATAGTGHNATTDHAEATGSICPAGWKLPTSGTENVVGSFKSLQSVGMNSNTIANNKPYYFQYGGTIRGAIESVNTKGYYWSATSRSGTHGYYLRLTNEGDFSIANYSNRYNGLSVRCVVRDNASNVPSKPVISPDEDIINHPNVSVTVNPILTLEVSDKEVEITPKTDEVMTGDFTATVSANQPYTISLSSAEGYDTALTSESDSRITAITGSQTVEAGKNGWGIRVCNDTSYTNCDNYKGIASYGANTIFYTSSTGAINHSTLFNIGIGINSDLPSGTYSTNILVTASQK